MTEAYSDTEGKIIKRRLWITGLFVVAFGLSGMWFDREFSIKTELPPPPSPTAGTPDWMQPLAETPTPWPTIVVTPDDGSGRKWNCIQPWDPRKPDFQRRPRQGAPSVNGAVDAILLAQNDPVIPPYTDEVFVSDNASYFGVVTVQELIDNWRNVGQAWKICRPVESTPTH